MSMKGVGNSAPFSHTRTMPLFKAMKSFPPGVKAMVVGKSKPPDTPVSSTNPGGNPWSAASACGAVGVKIVIKVITREATSPTATLRRPGSPGADRAGHRCRRKRGHRPGGQRLQSVPAR